MAKREFITVLGMTAALSAVDAAAFTREAGDSFALLLHFLQCRHINRWLRHAALFELRIHRCLGYQASAALTGLKKCRPPVVRSIC